MGNINELTENWFIKVNKNTLKIVNLFRATQEKNNEPLNLYDYNYYGKFNNNSRFGGANATMDSVELTLEQFKEFLLNQKTNKIEWLWN